jgi:hypothetical protein
MMQLFQALRMEYGVIVVISIIIHPTAVDLLAVVEEQVAVVAVGIIVVVVVVVQVAVDQAVDQAVEEVAVVVVDLETFLLNLDLY